ncbi:glycoside hydrolase family 95 protein [Bacteroides salyersiae]|jgi:glycoside hydrolase family 95|uniref:glycoside hydrolase family 95 protein n=2 Tax=Bacteroides salyersiae TaxID=291644 RepID=UPI00125D70F4|nr:glycoside hydrolase family 95 protein [Bacteroides salyersiae]KAB5344546.1 glycoside hydrolase family 95 protein [Bacteroides salyersiae]KAB5351480.1 glycoside hydrolase family 95 protein [Bacteroides salyersiae]KAB5363594.1 glycoside hydrolase family 95 protein [Bacteroides salyersiae]KAB5365960.1 glycoside hydrolase family 95 protein [Bacteroides salyersiae]KAB5369332.1 glycoside hydrolase family 95 protein [Bacteroides salyersiae]
MRKLYLCFVSVFLSFSALWAEGTDYTRGLSIWFDTPNSLDGRAIWLRADGSGMNPDREWENASLPIGNGSLGANILGSVAAERITLNEKTLWKGGPNTAGGADYYWKVNKQSASVMEEIRQAFTDGDYEKAELLTRKNFNGLAHYEEGDETPFRFGSFTTMGEIYVETGLSEIGMSDYYRALSLDSAMAVVSFKKDNTRYMRKYFISYPDSVMAMKFTANKTGKQNLVLRYCPNSEAKSSLCADDTDGLLYTGVLENNGMKFAIRIKAITKGGTTTVEQDRLIVKDADEVVFLLTADTDYKMNFQPDFKDPKTYVGSDPEQTTRKTMEGAIRKGYDELYRAHEADYTSLFNRVKLQLNPEVTARNLPTNLRLANYRKGQADYRLEELYYQYGRYLLIACSRSGNMPANLQGMWHNNLNGPWRVDYHNNINIQMNYWPACSTNLGECTQPLVDFIRSLVKPGAETAKAYFNARGWTASISANIFGFTSPLSSEDMSWNFNPMAGPWLATHIWEYYDYTRDKEFLKSTGYDLLKSSAQFTVDYLWHKPDGTYTAAPSTSPEHGPVDEGTTFVHAVVREILLNAIEASKVLGVDKKERKEWEYVLAHLAPYKIGRYGQLMEWSRDIDDPEDEHRHVNHLFGLHPGHTLSPVTTPELAQAARVVLEHRGDGATGWSMGWKLNQWARLQDGNHAYKLYGNLLKNGTLDNLWDTHAPFQIDGNFGGTAGITEMLLQSHMGFIQLLPALPDAWQDGSVSGICARGGFEVNLSWKDGKLAEAVVTSEKGVPCTVRYEDKTLSFKTKKGSSYRIVMDNNELKKKIIE